MIAVANRRSRKSKSTSWHPAFLEMRPEIQRYARLAFGRLDADARDEAVQVYVLAAWTGYRKTEISSLTKRSIQLDANPPTVTVASAYSKRKRQDTQVFHLVVAERMRGWLDTKKKLKPDALLFPVSAKIPGCPERRHLK